MAKNSFRLRILRTGQCGISICLFLALFACDAKQPVQPATPSSSQASVVPVAKSGKMVSGNLVGYNHTDKAIGAFYVDGEWGGRIGAGGGGGSFVCCGKIPEKWTSDVTVKVEWDDWSSGSAVRFSRVVPVADYSKYKISSINVHFLRSGEIKVFANMLALEHPAYPLKGKEAELKPGVPIEVIPANEVGPSSGYMK